VDMGRSQVLGGRIGAYRKWARCPDRTAATAPGTAAFLARFEREVDPDGSLSESERGLRAEAARRAYFSELVLIRHRKSQRRK